jgi:hypothetical protein
MLNKLASEAGFLNKCWDSAATLGVNNARNNNCYEFGHTFL